MSTHLDWSALSATAGLRIAVVMLVAGVPVVITEAGVAPTTVALSSGVIIDPLWWPGTGTLTETLPGAVTFSPVKGWLDTTAVWTFGEVSQLVEGDVRIAPLAVDLLDIPTTAAPGGEPTYYLSNREGLTARLLGATCTAAATSITIAGGTTGLATSGLASIGRETIVYSATGGGALVVATRGAYGSKASAHVLDPNHPPLVTFGSAAP